MEEYKDIKEKAEYCLGCKLKPCSKECPMHTNIPEFIQKVKEENMEEAYYILKENNIFSHICSIVCPQEEQCEGSCVRGIKQTPTQIGKIEKFVNEWAEKNNIKDKEISIAEKHKKVAVIGSGPAGIECAYELRKNGYEVEIFEKENSIGGILEYGIPDFRLEKIYVEQIVNKLKKMGVKFTTNKQLSKDIHLAELKERFDAIFLGIGAEIPSKYELGNFEKIYDSDYFLKAYNSKNYIKDLGNVVVIGGGNVAMDSARAAVKMGAESVSILYRRDLECMPAREIELKEATEDGVKPVFNTRVINAEGNGNKIESVRCIKTKIVEGKAIDIPNTEFNYKANSIVFAIGLKPNKEVLEKEKLAYNERGLIEIDENCQTSEEKVFAGGDLSESKSTVCRAIASAKKAAISIIKMLEKGE